MPNKSELPVPLESDEQITLVNWLDLVGLKHTAIPNSTYTKSWKQKTHNKNMGLHAGFPDLVVVIPADISKDGTGHLLALEMKRQRGGTVAAEQRAWIDALNGMGAKGVEAYVCKGAEAAIDVICQYIHPETNISAF